MMHESVSVSFSCPQCHSSGKVAYALWGADGGIRLSASFKCNSCGHTFEADSHDVPEDVRQLFYLENGRWVLKVIELGSNRAATLRGLRDALGLSVAEAGELLRKIPGEVADGTRVEVEVLGRMVQAAGAVIEISRSSS
ncbi:MJ0042-type zinc finger domain-containing protein [Cystobacter fuscus]|uniref:MJ0042-type zinc finger domain-containing protein n=1 Tax=Cystobacter fuscus TaxID=43 RepID=UPI002B2BBB11|nr:hypothetical protein F0U63_21400 [Cystobacter fuscus]